MYINQISENFDKSTRKIIMRFLILSVLNYCISVQGNTQQLNRSSQCAENTNCAAKVTIGGLRKSDHGTPALRELEWLTVREIRFLRNAQLYTKLSKDCIQIFFISLFIYFLMQVKIQEAKQGIFITCSCQEPQQTRALKPQLCVDLNCGIIFLIVLKLWKSAGF